MTWIEVVTITGAIFAIIGGVSSYINAFLIQRPWFKLYLSDRDALQPKNPTKDPT